MTTIVSRKVEGAEFIHRDDLKGEVEIRRGDESVTVPVAALCTFVAETIRARMLDRIQSAKPADLLSGKF